MSVKVELHFIFALPTIVFMSEPIAATSATGRGIHELTSAPAVERAIAEYDELGRDAFLRKYGFGRGRTIFLTRNGDRYDAKAIVGAAVGFEHPDRGPLTHDDFASGRATVVAKLSELGFEVIHEGADELDAEDAIPLREALNLVLDALAARPTGEWSTDLQRAVVHVLPAALRPLAPRDHVVKGGVGFGRQAEVPWVSILPPGVAGAGEGRYVVYLFAADASAVYLSLSQAVTGRRKRDLGRLAEELRLDAGAQPDLLETIDLEVDGGLGEKWRRDDGLLFDPWLRTHERLGAEVLGIAAESMHIEGAASQWEEWTGMVFPDDGDYVVPGALLPVRVAEGRGLYVEPNVWMRHSVSP